MSVAMLWLLKAAIIFPIATFIAYQNRHHKRSMWDTEEAPQQCGGDGKLKD